MPKRLEGHYLDVLARLHEHTRPRTYLEIGMDTGKSLALVGPDTRIVGIDPVPAVWTRINRTAQLFFETSDDFFARHDVRQLVGGLPIDLAFIDGLHLFEVALRDFRNVEACGQRESIVLIHDCIPPDELAARRTRLSGRWTGDTWKLVPCLKALRPDLDVVTLAVKPSGLTVVRNLDPADRTLWDRYDDAVGEFGALEYAALEHDRDEVLNVVDGDWRAVASHLPNGAFAGTVTAVGGTRRARPRQWPVVRYQAVRHAKIAAKRLVRPRARASRAAAS